jgi:hypothetical protein
MNDLILGNPVAGKTFNKFVIFEFYLDMPL